MQEPNAKLTIGGRTLKTGQMVNTPMGEGPIVSLDPFADEEVLVRLSETELLWFPFHEVGEVGQTV